MNQGQHITLTYGNRKVTFPISNTCIWHNSQGTLCMEIEAGWGDIDFDSIDGAYGPPMINCGWDYKKSTEVASIQKTTVSIPESYSEDEEDHVSTFYLSEHIDLYDLELHFGELKGNRMSVDFTGRVAEDPTGSSPDEGIKIEGHAILNTPTTN